MNDMMNDLLQRHVQVHREALDAVCGPLVSDISAAAADIVACLRKGGKLLIMGNGGSAADAQHFAAELVGRYQTERIGLPAIALSTDTSILTAVGNDYGYQRVFSRQVEALVGPDDLVVGISTSGHSGNVVEAIKVAAARGCRSIGLLGRDGGVLRHLVDLPLVIPVQQTAVVQEMHIMLIHLLCGYIDRSFSVTEGGDE